jgi:alpha-N-acetylglucosaminidase
MKIKFVTLAIVFGCLSLFPKVVVASNDATNSDKAAVYGLIHRILPAYADHFEINFIPKEDEKDLFEIESANGKIILRGNNGISIASALNYYLKNYAHCQITWNGTNLNLPNPLPMVPKKIQRKSPYKYRYYLNYCTFNYSMSWWDWERWQKEIDWMALNGINMPLAVTGQNSIWKRVYNKLGFSDKELESFFSGPAYFNWFWMGNLDGWGGPLPQSFMEKHEALQKKILHQERSLGMTPVLPAFTGHVPPTFQSKFPNAKLNKTNWVGFPEVNILNPNEPLFTKIGQSFIEEETKVYGTDHLYSADTFNENTPPTNDSTFLNDVSKKVYQSMHLADSDATWVMQGWLFHNNSDFWGTREIQALLNAVPDNHIIVLDLYSELFPVWKRAEAYYGKPWIWCMLNNFGKNISMSGTMSHVSQDPASALHDPKSNNLKGIGLTMEGIEQNPVIYDLMLENVWRDTPIDLNTWLKGYALRRYGKNNANANKAWELLSKSVYADTITEGGPESIITARPTFKDPGWSTRIALPYKPMELVKAWNYMITASRDLKESDGFQYDIVDITRQVLANYGDVIYQQMAQDYQNKDIKAYQEHSNKFIALITDMDNLLSTRKDFLLGNWLESAKKMGSTPVEKKLYEKNARDLITLWGDKKSNLREYACKQWSGMLNGFYKVRWQKFNDQVCQALMNHKDFDQQQFENRIEDWEWNWVNSNEVYPTQTHGNAVITAKKLYDKYYLLILKAYHS